MERETKTSESVLRAVNKYNRDSVNFTVSYKRLEQKEGLRVKAYLEQSNQNANRYIKELIKSDLDSKKFMLNDIELNE